MFVAPPLGFEPRQTDPKSVVLPLHHGGMVHGEGIAPPKPEATALQAAELTTLLNPWDIFGGPAGNRTPALWLQTRSAAVITTGP